MNPERWKRIDRILKQALSRPAERLSSFLNEACAGDKELRLEVESLIGHDRQAGSFIASPAVEPPCPDLTSRSLLHYRILEKIGEGGMGVVYHAHDTRLNRDVAIKLLPETLVADPERKARLEREARLLATLSHPNVAAIYGLEESDGRQYLVLEYVEGRTLAERIDKGRIPLEETLDICRQIAEGLEAAHEKGVVHRDLKPANVKVTPEGKVKILDFGLAKAFYEQAAVADMLHSPTITDEMTRPGVILGTAAYMSPEQARGKPVDKRADIWAFGCVLYECLTAKRAFQGESITDTMAAILKSEPDWALLPVETPPFVRSLLRQCLHKDPSLRLHDIADACVEMREGLAEPPVIIPSARRFPLAWVLSTGASALAFGLLIGPTLMRYLRPPSSPPVVRSVIKLEPGQRLLDRSPLAGYPTRTAMAISNDGRFYVYCAMTENPGSQSKPQLYLRETDQMEAKAIPDTEGASGPFLSPDNRQVGFWADEKLKKISVDGGGLITLCDMPLPFGASWGADNNIVFSLRMESGLFRVSGDGGKPERLTSYDVKREESSHRLPQWLPNGKGVLFTVTRHAFDLHPRVAVLELAKGEWRYLLEDAADARYVPTGHIVFLRQGSLMAVPFNPDTLFVGGQPVSVVKGVRQALNTKDSETDTGAGQFSISESGWLLYAPGGIVPEPENSLVWLEPKGTEQPVTSLKASFFASRLSPDGKRIAYTSGDQLWIHDIDRGTAVRLTSDGKAHYWSIWTPDGKRVTFGWMKSWMTNIYWQSADGSSPMERLTTSDLHQVLGSWSPDGKTLGFGEHSHRGNVDIMLLDLQTRSVRPLLNSRFNEQFPSFSPDGRWLAYVSNESGRDEVYVASFPSLGSKWQISSQGGVLPYTSPIWAKNGRRLLYPTKNQVWAVDIRTDNGFIPGKPHLLFERPGYVLMDVSPTDGRFLMLKPEDRKPQPVTEMILVQNWFEELKRLCPTGR